jgi:hypothetical protein
MDGRAERAVRVDGSIVVMVEFEGKPDRDKKQREEERKFLPGENVLADFQRGPPGRSDFLRVYRDAATAGVRFYRPDN